MTLLPTFGFTGTILAVINKTDSLFIFVKNDLETRVLFNVVSVDINKFVSINSKSTKIFKVGVYKPDLHLKIFYMGQELFNFQSNNLDKNTLLLYSNFILKSIADLDRIIFSPTFQNGITINTLSNKPQDLFIQLSNKDTNQIVHEDTFLTSEPYVFDRDYFINYDVSILNSNGKKIFQYNLDLKNKKVWIKLESKSLGDSIAWIPYVEEFRKKHQCEVFCTTYWNNLFTESYPYINFVSPSSIMNSKILFAIYKIKCSIPNKTTESPIDYREVSLQEIASNSLGLPHIEIRPLISNCDSPQLVDGEYVVISTASTSKAKLWNNPFGWQEVVDYLNSIGLKVVLLQKEPENGIKNVINMSGNSDILKTVNILKHCKFFIGLSSGTSWLAWALRKKVVMISGFTKPTIEFTEDNYRVINTNVCHGCWSDKNFQFDRKDWFWCPRNRNFECSREISSKMVIEKIDEILNGKSI